MVINIKTKKVFTLQILPIQSILVLCTGLTFGAGSSTDGVSSHSTITGLLHNPHRRSETFDSVEVTLTSINGVSLGKYRLRVDQYLSQLFNTAHLLPQQLLYGTRILQPHDSLQSLGITGPITLSVVSSPGQYFLNRLVQINQSMINWDQGSSCRYQFWTVLARTHLKIGQLDPL